MGLAESRLPSEQRTGKPAAVNTPQQFQSESLVQFGEVHYFQLSCEI